ncbi:MAG: hypothetical protein OSJ71_00955 [Acetatifactor sp.]|nr:hypothetical protein [Acetatifactor sp.]
MGISEEQLLRDLKMEDLEAQHREIAEVIGIENLVKLSRYFAGNPVYAPKIENLVKNRKYSLIRQEYDGTNIKMLATKYDVCESTVYNILRDMLLKGACKREAKANIPGQMDIMEFFSQPLGEK